MLREDAVGTAGLGGSVGMLLLRLLNEHSTPLTLHTAFIVTHVFSHTCFMPRTRIPILLAKGGHLGNREVLAGPHNSKGVFEG